MNAESFRMTNLRNIDQLTTRDEAIFIVHFIIHYANLHFRYFSDRFGKFFVGFIAQLSRHESRPNAYMSRASRQIVG